MSYPFTQIEAKWQQRWEERQLFRAVEASAKRKLYVLDMFPYPSGAGLHVGHPEGYTATDIFCRFQRMRGLNVLHPMGWDAFGLPAEQYAIETGTHPAITTRQNIDTFRRQIKQFGFSYDWDREINTTDPHYVKWTQWMFLQLYNSFVDPAVGKAQPLGRTTVPPQQRLAYMAEVPVWWCPDCATVLANEEVVDGCCERKGHPVARRPMRQWMLRITAYAERLLADLELLNWPESIKELQRHWIGRSEGAQVDFAIKTTATPKRVSVLPGSQWKPIIPVFTTRPDTLFGATYLVLSPEHVLVSTITTDDHRARVEQYCQDASRKSELERTDLAKTKTGVFTGAYAINPVNQAPIPVWVADYVLASYGTGAIMAVPAHDQRDLEFALQYGLDVRVVIQPPGGGLDLVGLTQAYVEEGTMVDSGPFTGLPTPEGRTNVTAWLAERGLGQATVIYRLRDWLFSRQRYWGEPIPMVHCARCDPSDLFGVPLPESALPLELPPLEDFTPSGSAEPPLAKATSWMTTTCPRCHGPATRETNTMPQWAGSCWYYLRYLDPHNTRHAWDPAKERYWMPVDLYVGGAEHAVLHLLYARFWHKVLYDLGHVSTPEPFQRLVNQGLILGEDGEKMSKSRGNVVNPDNVIRAHGADAFRLYEMFLGPLEKVKPWSTRGIEGIDRFLQRVWRLVVTDAGALNPHLQAVEPPPALTRLLHQTIKEVSDDIETLRLNTAISQLMILLNQLTHQSSVPRTAVETFVLLLSPFAPHLAEELWERLGHRESLAYVTWPTHDPQRLVREDITWVIQVNGRVRTRLTTAPTIREEDLQATVLNDATVKRWLAHKPIKQFIVVPKKLVNIVI